MVRQAPIDIDSDSSESRHQNITQDISLLKPSTSLAGQQSKQTLIKSSFGKSSSHESDATFTSVVTHVKKTGSQRKSSLKNQEEMEMNVQKKKMQTYYTLPHPGHVNKQQTDNKAAQQHNKKRRKSHGLTIKIESPTTGEDSSAGIIEPSGLQKSPNIFLSGVSISRGQTPASSPGGRHSRSPSLSIPPPSPLSRSNRHRSASLAVPSHKTPPHSPSNKLSQCEGHHNSSHFVFPQPTDHTIRRFGSLKLSDSTSALSSVLHIQVFVKIFYIFILKCISRMQT